MVMAAADSESAMYAMRKSINFPTLQAFKQMIENIQEMATRLPVTAVELANVIAAAPCRQLRPSALLPVSKPFFSLT